MYDKMSFKALVELAAPPTWSAGLVPVFLGGALALAFTGVLDAVLLLCTLFISIALQSAVNTLNDYTDFVKGTDSVETTDDSTDASLVYNNVDPKSARNAGFSMIVAAFAVGIYVIVRTGWISLLFACIGVIVLMLYALPKTPLSHTPFGELTSGLVMGGILTMAAYFLQTGVVDFLILIYALPCIIAIGLIMLVNNTSDIEKDQAVGRRTLPVCIGRKRATSLLRACIPISVVLVCVIVCATFFGGWCFLPVMCCAVFIAARPLYSSDITPSVRRFNMQAISSINIRLNFSYALCIVLSCLPVVYR